MLFRSRLVELVSQVPRTVISTLQEQRQQDHTCTEGEIVMLVTPNIQEQDDEYARYTKGKYMELWLDAYVHCGGQRCLR